MSHNRRFRDTAGQITSRIEPSTPIGENVSAVPQFDKWRSIGTDVLLTGSVTPASNGLAR